MDAIERQRLKEAWYQEAFVQMSEMFGDVVSDDHIFLAPLSSIKKLKDEKETDNDNI